MILFIGLRSSFRFLTQGTARHLLIVGDSDDDGDDDEDDGAGDYGHRQRTQARSFL